MSELFHKYLEAAQKKTKEKESKEKVKTQIVPASQKELVSSEEDIDTIAKKIVCENEPDNDKKISKFIGCAKKKNFSPEDILGAIERIFKANIADITEKYAQDLGLQEKPKAENKKENK